jgi:hypothetical protein
MYAISTARMASTATSEAAFTSKKLPTRRRGRKNPQSIGGFKLVTYENTGLYGVICILQYRTHYRALIGDASTWS